MSQQLCVLQDWVLTLTLQQQSVLMLACRGPDGLPKTHACRDVIRAYRGTVMRNAFIGRALAFGEAGDSFISLDLVVDAAVWTQAVKVFFTALEELPHHAVIHLLHGAEIIGYKHPDARLRDIWSSLYVKACSLLAMNPETEVQLDERLNDGDRARWD